MRSPFRETQIGELDVPVRDFEPVSEVPFDGPMKIVGTGDGVEARHRAREFEEFEEFEEFDSPANEEAESQIYAAAPAVGSDLDWTDVSSWIDEVAERQADVLPDEWTVDGHLEIDDEADDGAAYEDKSDTDEQDQAAPPWVFAQEYEDGPTPIPGFLGLSLSGGEFGKAMRRFSERFVPDGALWLLKQSPRFTAVVKDLDAAYVAELPSPVPPQNDAGVFLSGPKGRRWIYLQQGFHGSQFVPFATAGNHLPGDMMMIEGPDGSKDPLVPAAVALTTKGQWIERIAHESIHAQRHVLGKRRPGSSAAQRVVAAIDDEIATRKGERAIVDELRKKFTKFRKYEPTTGSFERWRVERDIFPGAQRMTYLEHFVLGEMLHDAARQLSDVQREKYAGIVGKVSLGSPPHTQLLTIAPHFVHPKQGRMPLFQLKYPNVLLAMRVIDARWRSIADLDRLPLDDPSVEGMRQEHAKAFFGGLITYSKRP